MRDAVRRGIRHPEKVVGKIRQAVGRYQNRRHGDDVMAEDWDNLLILDACRYDTFARLNDLPGTLTTRRSRGSATLEFVRNNFAGRTFPDTVYVTANPFVSMEAAGSFHALVDVWRTDWNKEFETVMPETMTRVTLDAAREYPDKRLISHYNQPHHPFIGPFGRDLLDETAGNRDARRRAMGGKHRRLRTVWTAVKSGDLDPNDVVRAYEENARIALDHARELLDSLDGRTVVTSDHGNLFGESPYPDIGIGVSRWGHPINATAPELVRVPWFVTPHETRRETVAESTEAATAVDRADDTVQDRLEALGYAE